MVNRSDISFSFSGHIGHPVPDAAGKHLYHHHQSSVPPPPVAATPPPANQTTAPHQTYGRTRPLKRHRHGIDPTRCDVGKKAAYVSPSKRAVRDCSRDSLAPTVIESNPDAPLSPYVVLDYDSDSDWASPSVQSSEMPDCDPDELRSTDFVPSPHAGSLPSSESSDEDTETAADTGVFYRVAPNTKQYDTVNACLFCRKLIKQKMRRHLKMRHSSEARVAAALAGTPKEQAQRFSLLINHGNYRHNIRVLDADSGELILKRRPKRAGISIRKFLPCPGCLAFLQRVDLHQHYKVCPTADREGEGLDRRQLVTRAKNLLSTRFVPEDVPDFITQIRDDAAREVICKDRTLILYVKTIQTRLVKLAKLLQDMRKKTGQTTQSMQDMCNARYFNDTVQVTRDAAGFDDGTTLTPPTCALPTVPRTVGTGLRKVCHILLGVSVREDNEELGRAVKRFKELLDSEWGDRMGRVSQDPVRRPAAEGTPQNVSKLSV